MSKILEETNILKNWHLKLLVLGAVATPVFAAAAAYRGVRETIITDKAEVSQRVDALELRVEKNFADKDSMQRLDNRTRRIEESLTEVKTLIKLKLK